MTSDSRQSSPEHDGSFRLLFSSNPLAMWVYDVDTLDFLEVNAAAVAQYGYARDEFLRMRVTDIFPAEQAAEAEDAAARVAHITDAPRRHQRVWTHRVKDGRLIDVDIVSHAMSFAGRRAALVVAIDVTEMKRSEAALARSMERLNLLHQIDRAVITAETPVAIAEAVLPRLRDLLGVPRAIVNLFDLEAGEAEWLAAVGRQRIRLGPGVRFPMRLMGDVDGLRRGEAQKIDTAALPPGPEVDALLASGVLFYMVVPMIAGGELIGGISFGGEPREFTAEQVSIAHEVAAQMGMAIAQARLYERVKRHAEELEERVGERTLALNGANEQLQQEIAERRRAQEEADHANRAKSDFLSRMSHELRTPLNAVLGFAQVLDLDPLTGDQRESVTAILKAGQHLLGLINEVLDISRIEAGRLSLSSEPLMVSEILDEALALVHPMATSRNVALRDASGTAGHYVLADRQRVTQVLLNLLSNAVKFNRRGGAVTVACTPAGGRRLRIAVTDTGPGIPADRMARLFTPFDRLGAEQTGVEGTGLGLALSKALMEAMNGAIGATSTVGQGSTFWVELPQTESPEGLAEAETARVETPRPVETRGVVLYVEDTLSNTRLVERVLKQRPGVRLLSAIQGRLGLELARQHQPQLVLLDLHLPDMSGQDVLRELRGDPRTAAIPVVIVSADASPGQTQRLLAAGAQEFMPKPLDVRKLLDVVDAALTVKERPPTG